MAQQIFDDGSSLTDTMGEDGNTIYSSTNATDYGGSFGFPRTSSTTSSPSTFSASGLLSGITSILDPSGARLQAARLLQGGGSSMIPRGVSPSTTINTAATTARAKDWRLSVTLADPKLFGIVKGAAGAIQTPLAENGGVIFPYVPQIAVTNNARYSEQALTHSNYKSYFYEGSDVAAITVSGEFTVQNVAEGQYLLASIYFFRSATKMFFGGTTNTGNPPPLVKLNGYGQYYFPNVSCVVTNFTHTMPAEVDYMEIPVPAASISNSKVPTSVGRETVRLPTTSTISITLQPVYSRVSINKFNLTDFAKGGLINRGFL